MWRRILAYTLFGLGFLTVTFFRRYSGEVIPYPFLFYLLGLAMFVGGLLFLRYTPTTKQLDIQKQISETIADLKTNGDKIPVDLTQCEIKEHNYIEEREKYGHSNELLILDFERQIQGGMQSEVAQSVTLNKYKSNRLFWFTNIKTYVLVNWKSL